MRKCALLLVDLEVPAHDDLAGLHTALSRWAQDVRFSVLVDARGVIVGDVCGAVVDGTVDEFVTSLRAVQEGGRHGD